MRSVTDSWTNVSLTERLKALVHDAISEFQLADSRLGICGWSYEHTVFLNFCLDNEIISKEDFETAVSARIQKLGRESYEGHVDAGMQPDHTVSPEALACAIRGGELDDDEVGKIAFIHGDTQYTFLKGVEDTFPNHVATQLLAA